MTDRYRVAPEGFLPRRGLVLPIVLAALGLIVIAYRALSSEIAPLEDKGRINLSVTAQEDATYDFMGKYMAKLVPYLDGEVPEAEALISRNSPGGGSGGINHGSVWIVLKPEEERGASRKSPRTCRGS